MNRPSMARIFGWSIVTAAVTFMTPRADGIEMWPFAGPRPRSAAEPDYTARRPEYVAQRPDAAVPQQPPVEPPLAASDPPPQPAMPAAAPQEPMPADPLAVEPEWPPDPALVEEPLDAPGQMAPIAEPMEASYAPGALSDWDLFAGSVYANTSPLWVQAEYLYWWVKGDSTPPLVTTSPSGTPREVAGVLGEPGTRVLFGGERTGDNGRSGVRTTLGVRLGHWFDYLMDSELEAHLLWLGNGPFGKLSVASLGDPILARPFFDLEQGIQDAQLVAFPGVVEGALRTRITSELVSTGLLFRRNFWRGRAGHANWLAGYRYLQVQDDLVVDQSLLLTDPAGPFDPGTTIDLFERFGTWNEFHGAELGVQYYTQYHHWGIELLAKAAIGGISRTVDVEGSTLVAEPLAAPVLSPGGLLTLPSNLGRRRASRFTMVPELGIRLRRRISHSFILTMGYTVLIVDHVARAGEQVDLALNLSQAGGGELVGAALPAPPLVDQTMWVHGFHIGLQW